MKKSSTIAELLLTAIAFAGVGAAQVGRNGTGMMGGGSMGGSMGGMMGGSLAGMMGGGSGLTVGPDGTLYLTRSAMSQAQGQTTTTTQVTAIDSTGKTKWTLPINSGSASQPAVGKDGTVFVTTSDWWTWMYDSTFSRNTKPAGAPNLLVLRAGSTSATISATVALTGDLASQPQIAADSTGSYTVFVVTVDMANGSGLNSGGATYLYAFSPSGAQKYRLQLSQTGSGMMGL